MAANIKKFADPADKAVFEKFEPAGSIAGLSLRKCGVGQVESAG